MWIAESPQGDTSVHVACTFLLKHRYEATIPSFTMHRSTHCTHPSSLRAALLVSRSSTPGTDVCALHRLGGHCWVLLNMHLHLQNAQQFVSATAGLEEMNEPGDLEGNNWPPSHKTLAQNLPQRVAYFTIFAFNQTQTPALNGRIFPGPSVMYLYR